MLSSFRLWKHDSRTWHNSFLKCELKKQILFSCELLASLLRTINKMYHIVEFTDGSDPGSCDIIPVSWFNGDNSLCYWPPYRSASKIVTAVKLMASPMDNWPMYSVRKIGKPIG